MNEREFAKKLKAQVQQPALSASASARLRQARESAVACAVKQTAPGYATVHGAIARFWHQHHAVSIGLVLALLIAAGGTGWQWQQAREADNVLVASLLADDLPVDMLLSGRFE